MDSETNTFRALDPRGSYVHNSCVTDEDPIAIERGERLKRCRKYMKWTQEQLAQATGWSTEEPGNGLQATRIANFEQGTRRIGHEEAEIFGRVFGIPAAYFMAMLDAKETEVIGTLRGLRARVPLDQTG